MPRKSCNDGLFLYKSDLLEAFLSENDQKQQFFISCIEYSKQKLWELGKFPGNSISNLDFTGGGLLINVYFGGCEKFAREISKNPQKTRGL